MRSMRLERLALTTSAAALLLTLAACGGSDDRPGMEPVVQDSAGVRIILNPGAGAWAAEEAWTLEEELRIGVAEGDPELQFGQLVGVDADAEGRIVTLDQQRARIRVFAPDGSLLQAFGRVGGGPGELSQALSPATGIFVEADGSVAVPDLGNMRIARFSLSGDPLDSPRLALETTGIPLLFTRTTDRELVVQFRRMAIPGAPEMGDATATGDRIVRLDPGSAGGETLVEVPAGETFTMGAGGMPQLRIFSPEPVWTVLSDGRVVTGTNNEYSLALRPAGETGSGDAGRTTIVRRSVEATPVTERHQADMRDIFRRRFEESGQPIPPEDVEQLLSAMEFAPTWPVLAAVLAGPEGTLWVQRVDAGELDDLTFEALQSGQFGSRQWDVFAVDGTYLGDVRAPEGMAPLRFVGDRLYAIHSDDLGIQRVARLRLIRPAG